MMRFGRTGGWLVAAGFWCLVNCHPTGPGSERWVYRAIGEGSYPGGQAAVVACGSDGTVYAAGQMSFWYSSQTSDTLEVVALTADGAERYRYHTSSAFASGLALDADGNLYIAGGSQNYGTAPARFLLISLDPTGTERWVYLHANDSTSGGYGNLAYSVVCGQDGNVYAAGSINGVFSVVSLTAGGQERWTYQPADINTAYTTAAQSVLWGADGNLYAGGTMTETVWNQGNEQTITSSAAASLTPAGAERWLYRRTQPNANSSYGSSLIQGAEGNLYLLCSFMRNYGSYQSMTGVASLTIDGQERWTKDYAAGGSVYGGTGWSLARSSDQGVYLGMYILTDTVSSTSRFSVASLDADGQQRWLYSHNHTLSYPAGISLTTGDDGNLYCAGSFNETGSFSLASLSSTGSQRWVYQYAAGLFGGQAAALGVAWGGGNVYAGGYAYGYKVGQYFLVVSLSAGGGAD
jgi:hypothetical protein